MEGVRATQAEQRRTLAIDHTGGMLISVQVAVDVLDSSDELCLLGALHAAICSLENDLAANRVGLSTRGQVGLGHDVPRTSRIDNQLSVVRIGGKGNGFGEVCGLFLGEAGLTSGWLRTFRAPVPGLATVETSCLVFSNLAVETWLAVSLGPLAPRSEHIRSGPVGSEPI